MALPPTMSVVEISRIGGPEVLRVASRPVPRPAAGEVLIRVEAIGVCRPDSLQRRGMHPPPPGASDIPGLEVAGKIESVGAAVSAWRAGDTVCALLPGGGYAQFATAAQEQLLPIPPNWSATEAATLPENAFTSWENVFRRGRLAAGETILVHAGGSGIGSVAIKMAKAIGCTVITTVGDDAKAEKAKALGADHVINYKTERFEGVTRKLTAKKGVDVVFEHVGGEGFNASLFCLKRCGRLVTCGSTAGPNVNINLMQLFQQQYKIFGSFGASIRNIRDSLSKIAAGMAPIIDTEVPLSELERGLARIESRQVFGKVIVNF